MRVHLLILSLFFLSVSCKHAPVETLNIENSFSFSPNKIWAHRVNSIEEVEKKHQLFEGMEIDLIYSNFANNFYVAHNEQDTLRKIFLEDWINHIPNPAKNWYWFDLKNLNKKNAEAIVSLLVTILNRYGIFHKTICESKNEKGLAVLKREGLAISYWISSDVAFRKITGNWFWKKRVERKIALLKPNALSSFEWMHPLLDASFPNENILYWYLPENETPEDVALLKELCGVPNVKVILVDYDAPISY
jgi:hypothetical protein